MGPMGSLRFAVESSMLRGSLWVEGVKAPDPF